jgi:hypothetical protein
MKKISLLFSLMFSVMLSSQEAPSVRPDAPMSGHLSYIQRVERGFGQRQEPRWAGDRPDWLREEEREGKTQRIEIVITGDMRNRMQFRGGMQQRPFRQSMDRFSQHGRKQLVPRNKKMSDGNDFRKPRGMQSNRSFHGPRSQGSVYQHRQNFSRNVQKSK